MKHFKRLSILCFVLLFSARGYTGTLVQFHLYLGTASYIGDIDVELYDQDKPITVNNFLRLLQSGAYQNSFFHRCEPGFVLQGGGFGTLNPFSTNIIGPPYDNVTEVFNFGNIPNEYGVGRRLTNGYGTLAMAKSGGDTNSAGSQFFFNLKDNPILDSTNANNLFVVFGHVLRGTNILNFFSGFSKGNFLVDLRDTYGTNGLFTQLPAAVVGTGAPPYYTLAYFTLTTLAAQVNVNKTNGARTISWNSINGLTNRVEFATNMPPNWQLLASTNGTGAPMSVTDAATNNTRRYYRIHVLY